MIQSVEPKYLSNETKSIVENFKFSSSSNIELLKLETKQFHT